jgi:hypothetical protein
VFGPQNPDGAAFAVQARPSVRIAPFGRRPVSMVVNPRDPQPRIEPSISATCSQGAGAPAGIFMTILVAVLLKEEAWLDDRAGDAR